MKRFKEWFENYWYYYKWHTVFGAFFLVFAVVIIVQLAKRETADTNLLYAGPKSLSADDIKDIENAFVQLTDDFDGDGKKNVVFTDILLLTDEKIKEYKKEAAAKGEDYNADPEFVRNMREKYSMELSAGDSFICLLSPDVYALDNASNAFMTLSELGISEEGSEDGVAIVFKSLPFASYSSVFDKLPDDTLVVFRRLGASASAKGKSEQERFDNQKKVFIRLCEFGK